jgi:16S rRNA (cytidine1402-2'-O)-methyltransferase
MAGESPGVLYVVGTPLGNLEDLSERARRTLAEVDLVAAEDTRRTRRLLSSIGLKRPLISYHAHNESRQTERLLATLAGGASVALVSDAGTPNISDPGHRVVRAALDARFRVVCIPGPSAVVAALSISGMPADRFVFEGFLPRKGPARRARLEALRDESRTIVFFEAVHRMAATMADLVASLGSGRRAAIGRELTKVHETLTVDSLASLAAKLGHGYPLKGEFVIVVEGVAGPDTGDGPPLAETRRVFDLLRAELPQSTAAKLTAKITGAPRDQVYGLGRDPAPG